MSNTQKHLHQNPKRIPFSELMGGTFAAGLLFVLLLVVVLIDTFFLPALMAMQNDPSFFADPCREGQEGSAGGFALLLCLVLGFALAGLHLFSRRSFLLSGVMALVFLFCGFFIIVGSDSLGAFLSNPTAGIIFWYHNLPSTNCADLLLRKQFYAQYKAVEDISVSSLRGGVQENFTIMLMFNLAIGALLAAIVWVAGGIGWLWRRLVRRRSGKAQAAYGEGIQTSWLGMPERTILFQTAMLTLLAALAMPIIILLASKPDAAAATIRDVIWVPALLFLLDLARWALTTASDALASTTRPTPAETTPDLFLQSVVNNLKRKLSNENKLLIDLPSDEALQDDTQGPPSSLRPGQGLIIEETLSARHFDLIAKTVNEQVLDHGKTVLIICPEEHLDRTEEIFAALLGSGHERGTRPRIWRIGKDAKRLEGAVDVLLTSQFSLETLAAKVENYRKELALLGGTVALNLHEADFGMLDVALDRLKPAIPNQGKLIGIFHSEPRRDMITRVENFSIIEGSKPRPATTARYERGMDQWVMVLDCNQEALLSRKENLPVGYRALIEVCETEKRARPFVFDATATYAALNWQSVSERLLIHENAELLARLDAIPHNAILPEKTAHSVALVDDKGNLADAVAVTTSTPAALEALKIVTLGAYPTARYLLKELQEAMASARDSKSKRDALKSFKDRFGSLTGKPRQGPRELATKIRMTFRAEANAAAAQQKAASPSNIMKLSQSRVADFLDRPGRAAKQLRINTSKGGLQRLFQTAFRLRKGESVVSVRPADAVGATGDGGRLRIKNFVLTGPPAADDDAVPVLSLRGLADQHLPLADHGLTYATGSRIWIGGNFQTIEQVDLSNRTVFCTTRNSEAVHPYYFVRDYALPFTETSRNSFAVEAFFEERASRQPFELITGYVDCAARTYQAYEYGTMRFPFGAGSIRPNRIPTDATSHAQLRSATVLRVLGDAGQTQPGRGRRSRGVAAALGALTQGPQSEANVVFTLAMTLQDVLANQFPSHAHRLSVICPQASQVAALADPSPLDSFVIERLRHLVTLGDNGLPVERAGPDAVPGDLIQAYEKFCLDFSERGRRAQGDVAAPRNAQYSLLLIEDSDHDLGCAQAFFEQKDRIFGIWRDFLSHCVAHRAVPAATGYDFGSQELSPVFDFEGALRVVEAMCDTKR